VEDVLAIADALGIERFAVNGGSGGGPHCLAVAARAPERVTRAACNVGVVPYGTPGFDWFEGMDEENVTEFRWALEGEDVLASELEREAAEMLARIARDPSKLLGEDRELPEADRAEFAKADFQKAMRDHLTEAFRNGIWGWADDDLAFTRPWGFDVTEIRVPTRVVYGVEDVLVPRHHGEWLALNVPNAEVIVEEGRGHARDREVVTERYGWLIQPD
jgi:pimeloyl-ACP methyl ester carboxylesterase